MPEVSMEQTSWVERWSLKGWVSYVFAIVLTLALMGIRIGLTPKLGTQTPYTIFAPGLILIAYISGFRQAMVASALALVIGWHNLYFDAPTSQRVTATLFGLIAMVAVGGVVAWQRSLLYRLAEARRQEAQSRHIADEQTALAEAERDRATLLSRELNHRVKNLFAVVSSIVSLSGRSEPHAKETVRKIKDRIGALAAAHTAGLIGDSHNTATLSQLAETILRPYRDAGAHITINGPEAILPFEAVTPLALILHELSTNAVKYGALAAEGGEISAVWTISGENEVRLVWEEGGGPPITQPPGKSGFGSTMLKQAERQLGAEVTRDWSPEGLRLSITFPLHRTAKRQASGPKENVAHV